MQSAAIMVLEKYNGAATLVTTYNLTNPYAAANESIREFQGSEKMARDFQAAPMLSKVFGLFAAVGLRGFPNPSVPTAV